MESESLSVPETWPAVRLGFEALWSRRARRTEIGDHMGLEREFGTRWFRVRKQMDAGKRHRKIKSVYGSMDSDGQWKPNGPCLDTAAGPHKPTNAVNSP